MLEHSDILLQIGIRLPDLLAGLAGGVVNAYVSRRSEPSAILGSMIVGALMANYLSDTFSQYVLGTKPGTAGFFIGVGGMGIAQGIIEATRRWTPFNFVNKGNGNNVRPSPKLPEQPRSD